MPSSGLTWTWWACGPIVSRTGGRGRRRWNRLARAPSESPSPLPQGREREEFFQGDLQCHRRPLAPPQIRLIIFKGCHFVDYLNGYVNLFIYQARVVKPGPTRVSDSPVSTGNVIYEAFGFFWGIWVVLLFSAFLKEIGSIRKLKGLQMDMSSLFFFSIEAMKGNFILVLNSKQRLHKFRFLQKLGRQKPCWDQARLL